MSRPEPHRGTHHHAWQGRRISTSPNVVTNTFLSSIRHRYLHSVKAGVDLYKTQGRIFHQTGAPFVLDHLRGSGRRRHGYGFDGCAKRRGVGPPRKPLPRKRIPADLWSLARGHTELCIRWLAGIVSQEPVPPPAFASGRAAPSSAARGRAEIRERNPVIAVVALVDQSDVLHYRKKSRKRVGANSVYFTVC